MWLLRAPRQPCDCTVSIFYNYFMKKTKSWKHKTKSNQIGARPAHVPHVPAKNRTSRRGDKIFWELGKILNFPSGFHTEVSWVSFLFPRSPRSSEKSATECFGSTKLRQPYIKITSRILEHSNQNLTQKFRFEMVGNRLALVWITFFLNQLGFSSFYSHVVINVILM